MPRKLMSLATILLLLVITMTIATTTLTAAPPSDAPTFVPGKLIVKFKTDIQSQSGTLNRAVAGSIEARLAETGVQSVERLFAASSTTGRMLAEDSNLAHIYRIQLQPNADVLQTAAALSADPAIEWAEPDYIARAATTPNDPLYSEQWGLTKIGAPAAWDVVTGTATVVIAVIDSGIDLTHGDLSAQLWTNPGEIPSNGLDDDNNGYIDDIHGWDFVNDDNDPADDNGHGTQVAGVAGAAANNGIGIAGVCWQCKLMPVKVMQVGGIANYSDIAQGILYAAQKGADVINLSLGGYSNSQALQDAIQTAVNTYGAVVIGGAGNDNVGTPFYPAAYDEVLAVAATTVTDTKAGFSDYGSWVDIAAPGQSITTTFLGGDWGPASGTSFAAPFASGVAGLLLSENPGWSEALVRAQLTHTADDIGDTRLGSGRLNAATAVTQSPHPVLAIASTAVNGDPAGRPTAGQSATVQVTLNNDWLDALGATGTLSTADPLVTITGANAAFGDISAGGTGTSSPVYSITVVAGAGYSHPIPFTLDVTANGGAYTAGLAFTITTRSAEEHVGGTIAADTVWTNDKTYIVDSNIGVAPGFTLTIQAGTEVRFNGAYDFGVGGTLIADGTATAPIIFRSNIAGDWGKISFINNSNAHFDGNGDYMDGTILRHVLVEDAAGGVQCNPATPYFSYLTVMQGGINCTLGTDPSHGSGVLPFPIHIDHNNITGDVTITGGGELSESAIEGNITTNAWFNLLTNTITGTVNLADSLQIQNNHIRGSLSAGGSPQVLNNTLNGGMSITGDGTIAGNTVENASGWAIDGNGALTILENRIVDNENGIRVNGGTVQGNLIANHNGTGLEIGNATVISNTITGNSGSAIKLVSGTTIQITGNNLEGNTGTYDIENLTTADIPAQNNWWGTTDSTTIAGRIFDFNDDFNKGQVLYAPVATAPVQTAPAYVRSVTLLPGSPVGIEQVAFDVEFSRPMEPGTVDAKFYTTKRGTWHFYNTANSGLQFSDVSAIAVDTDGSKWFGTQQGVDHFDGVTWESFLSGSYVTTIAIDTDGTKWFSVFGNGVIHFDGANWISYNTANSELPNNIVYAIAVGMDGTKWFATAGSGVARFDGITWTVYNVTNSGLPSNTIQDIAIDVDGSIWLSHSLGVTHFDNLNWTTYDISNSGLSSNYVPVIAIDKDGSKWFGTSGGGLSWFDGNNWTAFNISNSELPDNIVTTIAIDKDGSKWVGTQRGGIAHFSGVDWTIYNSSNSGLPINDVFTIAIDNDRTKWIAFLADSWDGGMSSLYGGDDYPITDNAQWMSPTRYRATYDINTLVPRDSYSITVQGAIGTDGIEIAPNSAFTFTVDYAGGVSDTTPPPAPAVMAEGVNGDATTVQVSWSADDPDSNITGYRYAIGSTQGGTDIINWTDTTNTTLSLTELGLISGEQYWVSVQAQNEGGLFSTPGYSSFVAGQVNPKVYLPLVLK